MKRALLTFCLICFAAGLPLAAEEEKLVLGVGEFTFAGLGQEEARVIEALLQSYLSNQGILIPAVASAEASADAEETEPLHLPDYSLSFSVSQEEDSRILEMLVINVRTGETARYTGSYRNAGELALKARIMVEAVFAPAGTQGALESPAEPGAEPLTEQGIVGAWRGMQGIEIIRFFPRGRGIAFFSSGAQMELVWRIEENTLTISQASANTERYYHPAPYQAARRLAAEAEPMRWELSLYGGGILLRGFRRATEARSTDNDGWELIPAVTRECEWTRAR
jgi:hypothetical protein